MRFSTRDSPPAYRRPAAHETATSRRLRRHRSGCSVQAARQGHGRLWGRESGYHWEHGRLAGERKLPKRKARRRSLFRQRKDGSRRRDEVPTLRANWRVRGPWFVGCSARSRIDVTTRHVEGSTIRCRSLWPKMRQNVCDLAASRRSRNCVFSKNQRLRLKAEWDSRPGL